jgi:alanyl-tRNA synthetase
MREAFLSFFEKNNHRRINPYPVVARWRDDLYFTHASIIDFQPYVTNGITPPPANPLVISQPCIRFVDVDNVGPTFGRHLTIFEMGGHHAFNYPEKEVYWKDQTVRYHHEFVTEELGVKSEEIVYKEDVWSGGGNAGPDLETIVCGLELATLVFMKFKVIDDEFIELPIRTVDTGYGIERYAWLSQGSVSCFHAVYESVANDVLKMAGLGQLDEKLLTEVATVSGLMTSDNSSDRGAAREKMAGHVGLSLRELNQTLLPIENSFAVIDHTKCLAFMLAEGVVPSNVREGYLTRLMLRRTYRLLRMLQIEERLFDIVDLQVAHWSPDFPLLKEMRDEILDVLQVEVDKFEETLQRGGSLVKRITGELKAKKISQIPTETLIDLYDSHGLPPEVVEETAKKEGFEVQMPTDFYELVAERHVGEPRMSAVSRFEELETAVLDIPETRMLYYEDPYLTHFEARVLEILDENYVVLEKTAFYPEGGGQPADRGYLEFDKTRSEVADVQKVGKVIIHTVKGAIPKEGDLVKGTIDWEERSSLMRHHTATHVLMGAARRVLGDHVWQAGSQKGVERSRLDISHFRRLTLEEIQEIERLANQAAMRNIPVETAWVPREAAEKEHGFRLYQGGVVPGREIRVVKTGDWEVEACGGTHLANTAEVGFIKIVHTERVQDGVERINFSVGIPALKAVQKNDELLWRLSEALNAPREKLVKTAERLLREWKKARREKKRLIKEIAAVRKGVAPGVKRDVKAIGDVSFVLQQFERLEIERMIETASEMTNVRPNVVAVFSGVGEDSARVVVMAGEEAVKRGVNTREIAEEVGGVLGGGGSGSADFAQAGGTRIRRLSEALAKAEEVLRRQLSGE